MTKKLYFFIIASAMLMLTVMSAQAAMAKKSEALLFIIHARSGMITSAAQGYQLTLYRPQISYFSNRPERKAGKIALNHFVADWNKGKNNFAKDNPNAALVTDLDYLKQHQEIQKFIILKDPKIEKSKHLLFTTVALNEKTKIQPGKYRDVVLFIDNECTIANCG